MLSRLSTAFCQLLLRFGKAKGGNVAMMFAIALVPMLAATGAVVDYTRAATARSEMQDALDATALFLSKNPATASMTQVQLNTAAQNFFQANFSNLDASGLVLTPSYTSTGPSVTVGGSATVPADFMGVVGIKQIPIAASSTAVWGQKRLRVALVLDNTGSMCEPDSEGNCANDTSTSIKINALKAATHSLLTQLQGAATVPADVYVSIVPFVKDVNVGAGNSGAWVSFNDSTNNSWDAQNGTCSKSGSQYDNRSSCLAYGSCSISGKTSSSSCTGAGTCSISGKTSQSTCIAAGTCSLTSYTTSSTCTAAGNTCSISGKTTQASCVAAGNTCSISGKTTQSSCTSAGTCSISGKTTQSSCTSAGNTCSKSQYTSQSQCTSHGGTWTAQGVWTAGVWTAQGVWTPQGVWTAGIWSPGVWTVATWTPASHSTWNGCITDRGTSWTSPTGQDQVLYSDDSTTQFQAEQYSNCPQSMIGLTNDWTDLGNLVDNMVANGNTNQPIGLVWGWQSLIGGAGLSAPDLDSRYQYEQVIILLSDGLNTQDRWYTSQTSIDNRMYQNSGGTISGTCANAKAAGIDIYTVQVDTGGDPTSTLLQNCASSSSQFFKLTSSSQIITTFQTIGTALSELRLSM